MERDPLAGLLTQPKSLNRFAYALGNPCKYTDPSGLWTCGAWVNLGASTPASTGGSIGIALDDKGNIGLFGPSAPSFGGSTAYGFSASLTLQVTNLATIYDLSGPFVNTGGSIGLGTLWGVTGDIITGPAGPIGVQVGPQVFTRYPFFGEIHGGVSFSTSPVILSQQQYWWLRILLQGFLPPVGYTLDFCELWLGAVGRAPQPKK